jgi:hypothetical protein
VRAAAAVVIYSVRAAAAVFVAVTARYVLREHVYVT